ncbi:hypothetical protein PHLGIDRAFT_10422 [Phlebiopsis gigantea 11061_1 CR5-6]|uniref:Uncharacterized protein n=1 Tax=Phlebiopsis gigantea (strain 11061_1 CR5-6) TaxID=745531 RepID=A0A0C3P218_PHLG1|nr:hypothetical protein PHLGIDRAFT_10422 [Phlebiopsis gigantea 11061_1 CR5-6]
MASFSPQHESLRERPNFTIRGAKARLIRVEARITYLFQYDVALDIIRETCEGQKKISGPEERDYFLELRPAYVARTLGLGQTRAPQLRLGHHDFPYTWADFCASVPERSNRILSKLELFGINMFKFDFDLAADEMDEDLGSQLTGPSQSDVSQSTMVSADYGGPETSQFNEHTLESLIQALPGVISYSPLQIPAVSGLSGGMYLSKRDLYDARFQLISSGSGEDEIAHNTNLDNDLEYVQAPSDLVPGKYEGGLKTWECSIDLAACVKSSMDANILTRKRLRTLEPSAANIFCKSTNGEDGADSSPGLQ